MATLTASAAGWVAIPGYGWLIGLAAAYVDATYLMPALVGKGKMASLPPRLQDVPVGSNEPGAPRIWAIGGRARVPTHILWQKEKVREEQTQHHKEGTEVLQKEVMIDFLASLNDRTTLELSQLIGNGKLLIWKSRNLVRITTHEMTAAVSGADVVITMANTLVPNPTDVFKVGDVVKLYGWVSTAGPSINGVYWGVKAIAGHTSTPGTITLEVAQGQSVASVAANAGNAFTPAHIERVDDALVAKASSMVGGSIALIIVRLEFPVTYDTGKVFNVGDIVRMTNIYFNPASSPTTVPFTGEWKVIGITASNRLDLVTDSGFLLAPGTVEFNSPANDWPRVEFANQQTIAGTIFPPTYVPDDHFHSGDDSQGEDSILVEHKGTGNIPAYRGVCYQSIDEMRVTQFGGQLPYSLEAIIRPDTTLTWAQAVYEVLRRAGVPHGAINVEGMTLKPFLGYYIRGFSPTSTSIQPLLLSGQLLGQERNGVICIYNMENADVTQVNNGAAFSDLGAHIYGEPRVDDKIGTEDGIEEDLPTSVGVRHQDPDNGFTDGYQPFGLRNPNGVRHENRQEVDVSTLVLSRKDAKNLATTVVRKAWVNNRRYRVSLPASYIDQQENDLLTMTDDDGNIVTGRIISRDIGANYIVNCTMVREDLDLAVTGSPVQTAAGMPPPVVIVPAELTSLVLDISSLLNSENVVPALRFACCARPGSHWAGARLFESTDGSTWTAVENFGAQSVMGTLLEDLPGGTSSETFGSKVVSFFTSPIDVEFDHEGVAGIRSCTQQEAKDGNNWCAIHDPVSGDTELAAFTIATFVATRTYELNGWLRGLRGTKALDKVAGCKLVLLKSMAEYPTLRREYAGLSQPTSMAFRFVPAGGSIDAVPTSQIVASWRNCRPLPVRKVLKSIGLSPFDARFTVEHWTREHLPLGALPPYSMDEPFEAYKLTVYDTSGRSARRVKFLSATPSTGSPTLRDKWFDYPASEQTADGYTPASNETFWIDVQQIGFLGQSAGLSDSNLREV